VLIFCTSTSSRVSTADSIEENLELVKINLNKKFELDSEIYFDGERTFAPLLQIAQFLEIDFQFNKQDKIIKFIALKDNSEIIVDGLRKKVTVGLQELDPAENQVYFVKNSFFISEDIFISTDLISEFLDVKIEYDQNELILFLTVKRNLKILTKQKKGSSEQKQSKEFIAQPIKEKIRLRTLQTTYSTDASPAINKIFKTTQGNSEQIPQIVNTLNLDLVGDINEGQLSSGIGLNFDDKNFSFGGIRQNWTKNINSKLGVSLGNIGLQTTRLSSAYPIMGLKFGSPSYLGLNFNDYTSVQGEAEPGSEVLLLLNEQTIARQIVDSDGKYDFLGVPRLYDTENIYKILQRSIDGSETVIREEKFLFFSNITPHKQHLWKSFAGLKDSPLRFNILGEETNSQERNLFNKALLGGQWSYGISPRMSMTTVLSADQNIREPEVQNPELIEKLKESKYLPAFSDSGFVNGQTASFTIDAKPFNSFGIKWENAISHNQNQIAPEIDRTGFGFGSTIDYDFRKRDFYHRGNLYYFNPSFYSPGNTFNRNKAGLNFSFNTRVKKQNLRLNLQAERTNLDQLSIGGTRERRKINFTHSTKIKKNTFLQNNLNINEFKDQFSNNRSSSIQSSLNQKITDRLDLRISGIYSQTENLKEKDRENSSVSRHALTSGLTYYLDKHRNNSLNLGFSTSSRKDQSYYLQTQLKIKENFRFQPAINFSHNLNTKEKTVLLRAGLFWQKKRGLRLGLEYSFSRQMSPKSDEIDEHVLSLNLFNTLGFYDKKAYLLTNGTNTGYLKAKVFVDSNENLKQDPDEKAIPKVKLLFNGSEYLTDEEGFFVTGNIPDGTYGIVLDSLSLPLTITPKNEFMKFKIKPGAVTEVNFHCSLNSATIRGKLKIKDLKGEKINAENIVIIAKNQAGKEVAYTYTDSKGEYILSELAPGQYKISVDKLDIERRNFNIKGSSEIMVDVPWNFEDFIEVTGIDFEITKTLF